ncbi:hypothetical protein QLX08_000404 [Tetragonisca angustula]|uniref:Uncharacterized protein n=1 Tax=Tetragonisca angustula TaxID=166442 RepID=A0AAW1ALQ0_9HYME
MEIPCFHVHRHNKWHTRFLARCSTPRSNIPTRRQREQRYATDRTHTVRTSAGGERCVERNSGSLGARATDVDLPLRRFAVSIRVTWPPVSRGGGEHGQGGLRRARRNQGGTHHER